MKRSTKPPLSLALQRAQVALHEAGIEVGRVIDLEEKLKRALKDWDWLRESRTDAIMIPTTPELLSLLPPKGE